MRILRICFNQAKRKKNQVFLMTLLFVLFSAYFYIAFKIPAKRTMSPPILISHDKSKAVLLKPKENTYFRYISNRGTESLVENQMCINGDKTSAKDTEFSETQTGQTNELSQLKYEDNMTQMAKYLNGELISSTVQGKSTDKTVTTSFPLRGILNVHVWKEVCNYQVESLRQFILFPAAPSKRSFISSFKSKENGNNFGQRVFGFILPDISGHYRFSISSSGNSELWLSSEERTKNLRNIAHIGSRDKPGWSDPGNHSQISEEIELRKNSQYFIEVLHKHLSGTAHLEVSWLKPGAAEFSVITNPFIRATVNDSHVTDNAVELNDYREEPQIRQVKPPYIDRQLVNDLLDYCPYEPSYLVRHQLVRFQGARNKSNTHFAAVYPPDTTNNSLPLVKKEDIWWLENAVGNTLINRHAVEELTSLCMKAMDAKYPGVYELQKTVSMEQVTDREKGDRYFLELQLTDRRTGNDVLFSEHVYRARGFNSLCYPERFLWRKNVTVNIIVPVRQAARWALYFIRNIAEIAQQTGDPDIHVVIVDYDSNDIDIEAILKKSSIPRYTLVKVPAQESFQRAMSLQRGADVIKDPHSILFMCDLHLKIPSHLISTIRKHCVEGKMAFAPVVKRLRCGYYPSLPLGYWETQGFGLFAIFKSDFDHLGGMNIREFTGWGGEDWELLDRVLMSGLEVERLKIPDFYHFYHPALGGNNQRNDA